MASWQAARKIAAKYEEGGFQLEDRVPPSEKDWNEYLLRMKEE